MMEVPSLFKNEENEISVPACVTDVEMNTNFVNGQSKGENPLCALIPAESTSFDEHDSISTSENIFPSGDEALRNDIIISKELNGIKNLFEDCSDISLDESRCATNKERLEDVYDKNVDSDLFFSNPTSCNSLNDTLLPDCNSLNVTLLPHINSLNVTLLPDSQKVDILEETEKICKNTLTAEQGTNNCINANSDATKVNNIQKENNDSTPLDLVNNDYPSPESQSINDCKKIKLIEKNLNNASPVKIYSSKDLDGDNPSLDIPCIDDGREIGLNKKSVNQLSEVNEVSSNDLENGNSLPDCRPINDSKESNSNEEGFNNTTSNEKNDSSSTDLNNDDPLPDSQCNENFKDLNSNGKSLNNTLLEKSDLSPNSVNYDNPIQDSPFIDDCKKIFLNSNEKMLNNISDVNKPFSSVNLKVDNLSLDKLGINIPMETNSNTDIDNHIETNSDITGIDKHIETNSYITNINNHIATNSDVTDIDNHIDDIPNPKSGNHLNLMVNGAKNSSKETPKRNENEVINVCDMFSTIDGSHDEKTKLESFKKCDEDNQKDDVLELLEQNNTARTNEEVVDDDIQTSSTSCDALVNSVVNVPCGKPEDSALLLRGTKTTKFNNSNKYTGDEILEELIDSNNETIIKSNELLLQATTSLSNKIPLFVAVETVHVQSKVCEILTGTNYSCNGKKVEETIHCSVQVPMTEVGKVNIPNGCSDLLLADNSNGRENKIEKSQVTSVKYLSMEVENEISLVDSSSNLEASQMFQTSSECSNIIKDKIAQSICEDLIDNPENKDSNSTTFIKAYRSKHISGEEVHGSEHVSGDVGHGFKHIPDDVPKSKHTSDEEVRESKQIYGDAVAINKLLDKSVTNDTFDIKIGFEKNRKIENQTEQNHNLVDVEEINDVSIFQSVQEDLKKKAEDQFVINHIESKPDVNHIKKQGISGELSIVDYKVNKNEGCSKNLSLQTSSRDVKLSPGNMNIVDYPGECGFAIDGDFISNADRKILMTNQLYDKKLASTNYKNESNLDYKEEEIPENNTKYKISTRNNLFSSSTVSSTKCKITNKKKNSRISPYHKKSDIKACSVNLSKSRVGIESLAENTDVNPSTPHFNTLKRKLEDMLQCAQKEEQNALKELKRMKKEKALVLKDILQEIQKVKKKFRI